MEIAVVILILILLIAGGLAAMVVLGGESGAASLPGWAGRRLPRASTAPGVRRVIDVAPEAAKPVATRAELAAREELNNRLDTLAAEMRATLATGDDRAVQLTAQLDALHRGLRDRVDQIGHDAHERWAELASRQSALEARQEAASERLRADLALHFIDHERKSVTNRYNAERAEVTAELYALLARLEAAIAAVTNPVLLPGEPYEPPADFSSEALVWENWKEVGERTFAFADCYSARRLYLSDATQAQTGAFVVELRSLLTETIYPNLRPNAGPAQRDRLYQALVTLAERFPALRTSFARDFREIAEARDKAGDESSADSGHV